MAKKGMRRPDVTEPHGTESNKKLHLTRNERPPVPEIQGKAKSGKEKARPMGDPKRKKTALPTERGFFSMCWSSLKALRR